MNNNKTKPMSKTKTKTKQPLLVTTLHKGVFFGYGTPSDAPTITLRSARMCIAWGAETKGVLGLAATGPKKGCRIGPAVPSLTLRDVTSCAVCSQEAAAQWEAAPWN